MTTIQHYTCPLKHADSSQLHIHQAEENCSNETLRAEPGLRLISVHGGKGGYEKLIYQLGYSKGTAIGQQCSILILGEKVVGFLKIYNL